MTADKRFLAFDIGASNGRALVGQWDGRRLACEDLYHFPNDPLHVHNSMYWDVLRLLYEVKQGLAKYAAKFGNSVDGIGLDTWGVDFGLFDKDGRLLGNPHHHRDSMFAGVADELKRAVGGYEVYSETGVMIEQVATITQLYALARSKSPALGVAGKLLMIPSILNYFLTGEQLDEHSNLSNTGVLGYRDGRTLADMMRRMGVSPEIVPDYVRPAATIGELLAAIKQETGLISAPVVACATHDTASAVISVPAAPNSNWAFLSCGTWSVLGIETAEPITSRESYDAGLTTAATADGKFMTRKNVTGLWIVQELRRTWSQTGGALDYGEMVAMAESASPFSAFIDVGDPRFVHPADMAEAILSYLRETGQPEPADRGAMLRIVFESMACKYRSVLETIRDITGASIDVVHIVGGGVNNSLLCQFTADALGVPVMAGPVEATSMGNLMMQMKASGEISSVSEGRDLLRSSFDTVDYQPGEIQAWNDAFTRYLNLTRRNT